MNNKEFLDLSDEEKDQYLYLCEEFGEDAVSIAFDLLGPTELFDGMVTSLEDYFF
jgi:hypothetical protein